MRFRSLPFYDLNLIAITQWPIEGAQNIIYVSFLALVTNPSVNHVGKVNRRCPLRKFDRITTRCVNTDLFGKNIFDDHLNCCAWILVISRDNLPNTI